jgi:hypothetical protein
MTRISSPSSPASRLVVSAVFVVVLGVFVGAGLVDPPPAHAWGRTGHRVVGALAERHLSESAARAVRELAGPGGLARIANWPDEIRSDDELGRGKSTWHYVTIPDGETYEAVEKDPRGDIIERIRYFQEVLRDRTADRETRWRALAWLTHLVGDIHQPLHVGRGDDRGGNDVLVLWFDEPSNLHAVWDDGMIDHTRLSYTEMVAFLDHATPEEIADWQDSGVLDWARESMALRERVYDVGDRRLGWRYSYEHLPVVERRLLQAGIRLAGLLEAILGEGPRERATPEGSTPAPAGSSEPPG